MASKRFEKGSPEWDMFQSFWRLTQEFYIPEEGDEYWLELINAIDEFCDKYKSIPLSRRIALALSDTLGNSLRFQKKRAHEKGGCG